VHYFLYEDQTDWQTIYENIYAIPLFEFLEYDTINNVFKFDYLVKSPFSPNNELLMSENELLNIIENTLDKRVNQLIVGWKNDSVINMMSGGVDSSYIAVLLKKIGFNNSFSASFEKVGGDYQYAIDVANYIKLNHKNIFINDDNFFNGIVDSVKKSELPYAYKGESFFNIIYNVFQIVLKKYCFSMEQEQMQSLAMVVK
jgi:asparagine synthetase B (glutamine-hydrolysing)